MLRKLLFLLCVTGLVCFAGLSATPAMAQTGSIQGTVTDSLSGNPLIGANVFAVEANRGAATNVQGHYEINDLPAGTYTIKVTYIGYAPKTKTVTVGNGVTTVNFQLVSQASQLGEIVVTAFGLAERKKTLTYQTTKVSAEDIETSGSISPVSTLIGKVAGLTIRRTASGVRPHLSINLRGRRSVTGGSNPVIVIDGVRASVGALEDLNSQDIKSFNILKGASAAALYGSDAVNGAIVVTTKTGAMGGEFTIGIKNSTMWRSVSIMPDHQTKFGSGINGIYTPWENTNWGPRFDGQIRQIGYHIPFRFHDKITDQMNRYAFRPHNLRKFYTTGLKLQNTIYFRGGGKNGSFYMSAGYDRNSGIVPQNIYQRYTFTANAQKSFGEDIHASVHTSFSTGHSNIVGNTVGSQGRNFHWYVINTPLEIPLKTYKNWREPFTYANPSFYYNAYYISPWAAIGRNRAKETNHRLRGNLAATWDITNNIDITGTIGVNAVWNYSEHRRHGQDYPLGIQTKTPFSGFDNVGSSMYATINGNVIAEGSFQLSKHFGLDATLGTSVQMYNYHGYSIGANNLSVPGFYDPSNGSGANDTGFGVTQYRKYGFFGKLKFNYNEWVYILFTGRKDYTSTLPEGQRSYFYPSEGITLLLAKAIPALGNLPFLSSLRITANNSTVYNDLAAYRVNEVYQQAGGFPYKATNGFVLQGTTIDPNIQKEKIVSNEIGLDAAFFNNRLTFSGSWFYNVTTNLITEVSPSITSGASVYLTNIGQMHNTGWGIKLTGDIIRTRNLLFNIGVTFSHHIQIVDKIKPDVDRLALAGTHYAVVGKVFPLIRVTSYKRHNGHVVVNAKTGIPVTGNLQPYGQSFPNYTMGINPSISYKGLTLRAQMTYRTGFVYFAQGLSVMSFTGRNVRNAAANRQPFVYPNSVYDANPDPDVENWVKNTNIPITKPAYTYFINNFSSVTGNYIRDGRNFQLRTIALSYTLPASLLSQTALSQVTVALIANNLLILTPTDQTRFTSPEFHGGYFTHPPTRSYGFSVNIQF